MNIFKLIGKKLVFVQLKTDKENVWHLKIFKNLDELLEFVEENTAEIRRIKRAKFRLF